MGVRLLAGYTFAEPSISKGYSVGELLPNLGREQA
jgi:hypothetical protein